MAEMIGVVGESAAEAQRMHEAGLEAERRYQRYQTAKHVAAIVVEASSIAPIVNHRSMVAGITGIDSKEVSGAFREMLRGGLFVYDEEFKLSIDPFGREALQERLDAGAVQVGDRAVATYDIVGMVFQQHQIETAQQELQARMRMTRMADADR